MPKTLAEFIALIEAQIQSQHFQRLVLSKSTGEVTRVSVKLALIRREPQLSMVSSYATRDETHNFAIAQGLAWISQVLGKEFRQAHLFTNEHEWQVRLSRRDKVLINRSNLLVPITASTPHHDREKKRYLDLQRPFLQALGISTKEHTLVPSMAKKWKQINHFLEVFSHALSQSPLANQQNIKVADFGAGKAYLTFAVHDWLTHTKGKEAQVTGIEIRPELVSDAQQIIAQLALKGMHMISGDVRTEAPPPMDVMIALHACDTATDYALNLGIKAGAHILLCSPCCHKEIRAQLQAPSSLSALLSHGIHAEQQAEMLTDTLRALLLQAHGYETKVIEFVALEHTRKNKMILAVKRASNTHSADWQHAAQLQLVALKTYFGIQTQCLEQLSLKQN